MTNKASDKAAALMMNQLKVTTGCNSPRNGYVENGPKSKRRKFNGANGLLIPGLTHMHQMPSGSQSPKEEAAEALTQLVSPRPTAMQQDQLSGSSMKRSASAPHLNGMLSNGSLQVAANNFESHREATNLRLSALEKEMKSMKEMLKTIAAAVGASSPMVEEKQGEQEKQEETAKEKQTGNADLKAEAVIKMEELQLQECKDGGAEPSPRPTLVST